LLVVSVQIFVQDWFGSRDAKQQIDDITTEAPHHRPGTKQTCIQAYPN